MSSKMKQEFEKLPEIKSFLNRSDGVYWSDKHEYYTSLHEYDDYSVGFVNGAMYAYREQQRKIDELEKRLKISYANKSMEVIDSFNSKTMKIEEF